MEQKLILMWFLMRFTERRRRWFGCKRIFELLNIPQTSCDYYKQRLTFNKRDMLSVF